MALHVMTDVLSDDERKRVAGTVKILKILAIAMAVMCLVGEAVVFKAEMDNGFSNLYGYLIPVAAFLFAYLFVSYRYLLFPADLRANQKLVADTTVLRKKKLGWFDMDARGGLSNVMMGSAYYLYIPDDTKRSGQRRFRILMDAYNTLQPGDKIRVAWLPKSGQILSIDMPDFHWVAWDRKPNDHA